MPDNQTPIAPDWHPLQTPSPELPAELRDLRQRCPVPHATLRSLFPFYSALSYEDVTKAARDTATFSNAGQRMRRRRLPLESDPPEHSQIRKLLQPFFMPGLVAKFEPATLGFATPLVEAYVAAGAGDAMESLAKPLPVQVLLEYLGGSSEDWRMVKRCSEQIYLQHSREPDDREQFVTADEALWQYSERLVRERLASPRDPARDIISALLLESSEEAAVDRVVAIVRLFIAAGHDSTTSSIGICLHYLARNPADQQRLREQPDLVATAIEEMLRFESPVVMMPRIVTRDTELHGRQMVAGDRLMLNWAAANRDEAKFSEPERCLLDRKPNPHVVFGYGIHSCIGAPLARQEIRVALQLLLARTKGFELDGEVSYQLWQRLAPAVLPLRLR